MKKKKIETSNFALLLCWTKKVFFFLNPGRKDLSILQGTILPFCRLKKQKKIYAAISEDEAGFIVGTVRFFISESSSPLSSVVA